MCFLLCTTFFTSSLSLVVLGSGGFRFSLGISLSISLASSLASSFGISLGSRGLCLSLGGGFGLSLYRGLSLSLDSSLDGGFGLSLDRGLCLSLDSSLGGSFGLFSLSLCLSLSLSLSLDLFLSLSLSLSLDLFLNLILSRSRFWILYFSDSLLDCSLLLFGFSLGLLLRRLLDCGLFGSIFSDFSLGFL